MITLNPQDFEMTLATLTLIVIMITLNPQDFEIILATLTDCDNDHLESPGP